MQKRYIFFALLLLFTAVSIFATEFKKKLDLDWNYPQYAQGFRYIVKKEYSVLELLSKYSDNKHHRYCIFFTHDRVKDIIDFSCTNIFLPIKSIAVTSSTHIASLAEIDALEMVTAAQNLHFIHNEKIKNLNLMELGNPVNVEGLVKNNTALLISDGVEFFNIKELLRLQKLNINVFINQDFKEETPLARAEWIIALGILVGKSDDAAKKFQEIKKRYLDLKQMATELKKTTSLIASVDLSHWTLLRPNSNIDQIAKDAGMVRVFQDAHIYKSLENIYANGLNAATWLLHSNITSRDDLLKIDKRLEDILKRKNGKIYSFAKEMTIGGGNDYWETAVIRPDLLLQELIAIGHQEVFPDCKLRWYKKL